MKRTMLLGLIMLFNTVAHASAIDCCVQIPELNFSKCFNHCEMNYQTEPDEQMTVYLKTPNPAIKRDEYRCCFRARERVCGHECE